MSSSPRVCIIGAGCSGITAIKNCLQAGITNVVCYEKGEQIGGNWVYTSESSHSSVCETTHIISSKKLSAYIDFPMPEHYPDYPSHRQVLAYFESYVTNFGLAPYIRLNTTVKNVEKLTDERWQVELIDGSKEAFDYLMTANGHHSVPRYPEYEGEFTGVWMHSHDYKTNEAFKGKRVLIVGAGNSGCDCAVEISRVAKHVAISMRRPYYIIPKFMMGRPTDTYNEMLVKIPGPVQALLRKLSLKLQVGNYEDYGLETPDYPITKCHPVLNSELLYRIRHGKVHPRKAIKKLDNKQVFFVDGTEEQYDVIICATGYKVSFPFFSNEFINYDEAERIPLYLRMIHPEHPRLFFIGLVQPQGCVWPISDHQAKLAANHIMGRWAIPNNIHQLAEQEATTISKEFLKAKRHSLEVHYHPFIKKIQKEIPKEAPDWTEEVSFS